MKYAILMLLAVIAFGQTPFEAGTRDFGDGFEQTCSASGKCGPVHYVGKPATKKPAPKPKGKAAIITACTACTSSSPTTVTTTTPPDCASLFGNGWMAGKGGVCYNKSIAEPIDVSAIPETRQMRDIPEFVIDCGLAETLKLQGLMAQCLKQIPGWTCADKSRALLVSIDGKKHACHRLTLGDPIRSRETRSEIGCRSSSTIETIP